MLSTDEILPCGGRADLPINLADIFPPRSPMNVKQTATKPDKKDSECLVKIVAEAMKNEPSLRAVKIDRDRRSISLATLGHLDHADLERSLLEDLQKMESADQVERCPLLEGAPDCSICQRVPESQRGGLAIKQNGRTTTVSRVTCATAPHLYRWKEIPWPHLTPRQVLLPDEADHEREWKQQLAAATVCGVAALAGILLRPPASTVLFGLAYLSGAWFTVYEVWERLRKGVLDVHFLMLAVALGSASIGALAEGSLLLFLFSFSGALEHYAMGRTHREIRSLFKSAPKEATLLDPEGLEKIIPVEQVQPGMRLLIKPGDQFPVDAELVKGQTASDESNLTGEAIPVDKTVGDSVWSGTLNLWGAVEVLAVRPPQQSALQKVIHLIQEAQHLRAPSQRFTDRFGSGYAYSILGLSLTMFLVWWLVFGYAPFSAKVLESSAFYRAMTLLVVASPCALVLSIPSAILAAIAWAARRGILFRGGAAVEKLAEVGVVAMDKTGTLTTGELRVEKVESFPPGQETAVAQWAFSVESLSTHPMARAVTHFGKQQGIAALPVDQFESVSGMGLRAQISGSPLILGRRQWVGQHAAVPSLAEAPALPAGFAEVWLVKEGVVGRLVLRDDIRPQSQQVVDTLRQLGLRTLVLTGDRQATADQIQARLHLDEARGELKPEQKVEAIASLVARKQKVAMIGDGVNDAPSLAAAHVGVAMGARGSDAALEQAEVVLMHDRLENFLTAYELSRRARVVIRQNLVVSLATVVVLVGCALAGAIPLTIGVLGHEGSTVIVVLNSLRLLFFRGAKTATNKGSPFDKPRVVAIGPAS